MSVVFDSRDLSAVALTLGLDVVSPLPPYSGGAVPQDEFHRTEPEASEESSSIGVPDESDDHDEDEEEVNSNHNGSLQSLASLDESLPIKRGLSSYYSGKSKSFGNISGVKTVKEIEKMENPLNKRRRTMIAYKWSNKSKSSFCATSMPLLALNEAEGEDEIEEVSDQNLEDEDVRRQQIKSSKSCFSLTDLRK